MSANNGKRTGKRNNKTRDNNDSFLPRPGQASGDPEVDFVAQCFVVVLGALWGIVALVAWLVWGLLCVVYQCVCGDCSDCKEE